MKLKQHPWENMPLTWHYILQYFGRAVNIILFAYNTYSWGSLIGRTDPFFTPFILLAFLLTLATMVLFTINWIQFFKPTMKTWRTFVAVMILIALSNLCTLGINALAGYFDPSTVSAWIVYIVLFVYYGKRRALFERGLPPKKPSEEEASADSAQDASVQPALRSEAGCPFCGRPVESGSIFCAYCGNRLQQ